MNKALNPMVMDFITSWLGAELVHLLSFIPAVVSLFLINSVFVVFEVSGNREALTKNNVLRSYIASFGMWFLYLTASVPAGIFLNWIKARLGIQPLISAQMLASMPLLASFLSFFVFDFFYYWFHRLSHQFYVLWRFHSIHHAIEDVNSWSSYHHWTEEYLRIYFITLPFGLIMDFSTSDYIFLSAMMAAWGQYIHTNASQLALPVTLRRVFADNVYHRYHHSIEREHYDKNFAAFFPFWDLVFGTQHFPKTRHMPRTGLVNARETRSLIDYIIRPFTMRKT